MWLAFYFHILTTMHGQNHFKIYCFTFKYLSCVEVSKSQPAVSVGGQSISPCSANSVHNRLFNHLTPEISFKF
jgi:hypothetical protein